MVVKRKIAALSAAVAVLTGCAGAELVHLAYQTTAEQFTIQYRTDLDTSRVTWAHGFDAIEPMRYTRHFMREDGKCKFDGVLIPWARTWQQEVRNGDTVTRLPPKSDEVAGYAAVIYKKRCPDQPAQAILHVGEQGGLIISAREGKAGLIDLRPAQAMDVLSGNQDFRPQWLPQVVARAIQLAPSNPAAKQFVVSAKEQLIQALPDQKAAITAAAAQ